MRAERARLPGKPSQQQQRPAPVPPPRPQEAAPPVQPAPQPEPLQQEPLQQAQPEQLPQVAQPQIQQQAPLPSPQDHSELAQHLLDLSQDEPDPERRLRLNELAAMNAAFGMIGEPEVQ
jgi:hypothetical protein